MATSGVVTEQVGVAVGVKGGLLGVKVGVEVSCVPVGVGGMRGFCALRAFAVVRGPTT